MIIHTLYPETTVDAEYLWITIGEQRFRIRSPGDNTIRISVTKPGAMVICPVLANVVDITSMPDRELDLLLE